MILLNIGWCLGIGFIIFFYIVYDFYPREMWAYWFCIVGSNACQLFIAFLVFNLVKKKPAHYKKSSSPSSVPQITKSDSPNPVTNEENISEGTQSKDPSSNAFLLDSTSTQEEKTSPPIPEELTSQQFTPQQPEEEQKQQV